MMTLMTFPDWREPVRLLRLRTGPAAPHQLELASLVGCSVDASLPFDVAAARLEAFLEPRIRGKSGTPYSPTEAQMRFLLVLDPSFALHDETRTEMSAWIDYHLSCGTADALEQLKLQRGDTVEVRRTYATGEPIFAWKAQVSSIGGNGLVYFKGGNGQCAWPRSITRV